jgi:hypothetical protein
VIVVAVEEPKEKPQDSAIVRHTGLSHLYEVENLEIEMVVELETSGQEIDPSSSCERSKARVIWTERHHGLQERACMTCGGGPCLIGKAIVTSDHHEEVARIAAGNANELQIQVGPGSVPSSASPAAFCDSPQRTQR